MSDHLPIRRALISVSDKSGLVDFARALSSRGVELISTGGTASSLRDAGLKVTGISDVTGFPEIMDGRVKTLHPAVHGALLALRDDPAHMAALKSHGFTPIDLVCVNLYPFQKTIARPGVSRDEAIEQIDIGGPAMIRSASKNFESVTVLTSPADYASVAEEITRTGGTSLATRSRLAASAFEHTARYDAAIAAYLAQAAPSHDATHNLFPPVLDLHFVKADELRYGENPHQPAAIYRTPGRSIEGTIPGAEQLHGKELSYNNIADGASALALVQALSASFEGACAAVIKHNNPCGASARARSAAGAIEAAIAGDPIAAFGGILAVSTPIDEPAAEAIAAQGRFFEVLIAPGYSSAALARLQARSANLRILATGMTTASSDSLEYKAIPGGLLAQQRDAKLSTPGTLEHRAGPPATSDVIDAALFLEIVTRALLSNAVSIGAADASGTLRLLGAGAGQMDRLTSCRIAAEKAGAGARGAVACSDAFFPFADGPTILADAGVRAIVHPGGSKRDQDTFDLCSSRGITCLTTGLRHFRH
jgi:phosphoribosylaminoimidazolecarboxamide formyltransferase/IMP cyclohydrolase